MPFEVRGPASALAATMPFEGSPEATPEKARANLVKQSTLAAFAAEQEEAAERAAAAKKAKREAEAKEAKEAAAAAAAAAESRESAEDSFVDPGGGARRMWKRPVERARRRKKSSLSEMFQKQLVFGAPGTERSAGSVEERTLVGARSTKTLTSYLRKTSKQSDDANVVAQGTGGAGSTGGARMLDDVHPTHKVLLYRLVSLPDPNSPWGDGLLAARENDDDDALFFALGSLLNQRWCEDPILKKQHADHMEKQRETGRMTKAGRAVNNGLGRVKRKSSIDEDASEARPTDAKNFDANPRERTKRSRCTNSVQRFSVSEHERAKSEEARWELPKSDDTWGHVLVHARGVVGETALHLLFLLHSTAHRRLTKLLVPLLSRQRTPDVDGVEVGVLDASYIGQPYHGEVCLHFAIVHNDLEMVKVLIENGADCRSPHASGDFFYEHRALYFGGSCLGFAACMDQKETVKYLLNNPCCKADVNQRDLGALSSKTFHASMALDNTVLHCLVLHDKKSMYEYLVSEHEANAWATNVNGDTPLLLACRRSLDMAEVALDSSRQLVWSYASVSCVKYPLYELEGDARDENGNTVAHLRSSISGHNGHSGGGEANGGEANGGEANGGGGGARASSESSLVGSEASAAAAAAAGRAKQKIRKNASVISVVSRERVASLLYSDVLWQLINDKWVVFGRRRFFWFALVSMLAIVLLTLSLCQPGDGADADTCNGVLVVFFVPVRITISAAAAENVFRASLAFDVYLFARLVLCMHSLDLLRDPNALLRQAPGLLSYTLPWVGWGVRTIDDGIYRTVLGLAAFMGWIHFMKVSFSFNQNLGPMVLTVEEMLKSDMTTFSLIYVAYMHAFGAAMLGMFSGIAGVTADAPAGYDIYNRLIRYTINPDLPDQSDRLVHPSTAIEYDFYFNLTDTGTWRSETMLYGYFFVEFLWAIVASVVLLNLLIAMMSNRYNLIMDSAEAEWRLQFCDLVMLQEATPWWLVPLPNAMPWATMPHRRPTTHTRGKLSIIDANENRKEVDCWFLQMNLNANNKKQADDPGDVERVLDAAFGGGGHGEGRRQAQQAQQAQTDMLQSMAQRLEKMETKLERTHHGVCAHHEQFRRHHNLVDDDRTAARSHLGALRAADALAFGRAAGSGSHLGDSPREREHVGWGSMGGGRRIKPEWLDLLNHVSKPKDDGFATVVKQAKRQSEIERKRSVKIAHCADGGSSNSGGSSSKKTERDEEREEEMLSRKADGHRSMRAAPPPASELRAERRAAQRAAAESAQLNANRPAGPPVIRSANDMSISTATQMILQGAAQRWGGQSWSELDA